MKLRFSDLTSTNNHYYSIFKRVVLVLAGVLVTVLSAIVGGAFYIWTVYNANYKLSPPIVPDPQTVATKWLNTVERV